MRWYHLAGVFALVLLISFLIVQRPEPKLGATCSEYPEQSTIVLPEPDFKGKTVEDAIEERRSIREYSEGEISIYELSMLLWAGNGVTGDGLRSAPSAGGLYPVDLYVIPKRVENLSCGIYRYIPAEHKLVLEKEGEFDLYDASYDQMHARNAAVLIALVTTPERTTGKYGTIGNDFVLMETGHISQNILLESVSLGLGAVPIGGFEREKVDEVLGLNNTVYIVAIGKT